MNKRELYQWLKSQGCDVIPKEGINNTAPPVEVVNKKTGRYSYFALPNYTDEVSSKTIEKLVKRFRARAANKFLITNEPKSVYNNISNIRNCVFWHGYLILFIENNPAN